MLFLGWMFWGFDRGLDMDFDLVQVLLPFL